MRRYLAFAQAPVYRISPPTRPNAKRTNCETRESSNEHSGQPYPRAHFISGASSSPSTRTRHASPRADENEELVAQDARASTNAAREAMPSSMARLASFNAK